MQKNVRSAKNKTFFLFSILVDRPIEKGGFSPTTRPMATLMFKFMLLQAETDVAFVYQPGTTSYSRVLLPEEGSLELTFVVHDTTGTGVVYTSTAVTNPGPALHDAMIEVPLVSCCCLTLFIRDIFDQRILHE